MTAYGCDTIARLDSGSLCTLAIITHERRNLFRGCYGSVIEAIGHGCEQIAVTVYNSSLASVSNTLEPNHRERHVPMLTTAVAKRQLAVSECVTPWLIFLDDDCEVVPVGLAKLQNVAATAYADVGAVFCFTGFIGPKSYSFNVLEQTGYMDAFRPEDRGGAVAWGTTSLAMFRVAAVVESGGFNIKSTVPAGGEDIDICLRLRSNGWHLRCVRSELALHTTATWNDLQRNVRRSFNYGRAEFELQTAWPQFCLLNPASLPALLLIGLTEWLIQAHTISLTWMALFVVWLSVGIITGETICQLLSYKKALAASFLLALIEVCHGIGHSVQALASCGFKEMYACFDWNGARNGFSRRRKSFPEFTMWLKVAILVLILGIARRAYNELASLGLSLVFPF